MPDLAQLNAWALEARLALPDGKPLRFDDAAPGGALAYESAVAHDGIVRIRRDHWHDALNALAWLAFPKTKAALNARHVRDRASATPNTRTRGRDAATLLDESGLVLVCGDPELAQLLRERAWRSLFGARRDTVARAMRPFAIGHGMLVKLLAPFRAITARTLILPIDPATPPEDAAGQARVDAGGGARHCGRGIAAGTAAAVACGGAARLGSRRIGRALVRRSLGLPTVQACGNASMRRFRAGRSRATLPAIVNSYRIIAIVIALLGVMFAAYVEFGTPRRGDVERSFGLFAYEASPFVVAGILALLSPFGRTLCAVGLAMLALEAYAYYVVFVLPLAADTALIYLRKPFFDLAIIATGMLAGIPGRARPPAGTLGVARRLESAGDRRSSPQALAAALRVPSRSRLPPPARRASRSPTARRPTARRSCARRGCRAHDRRS